MFEQYPKCRKQVVSALRYGWQTCIGLDERRVVTLPRLREGLAVNVCLTWFAQTFGHTRRQRAINVIRIDDPVWKEDLTRFRASGNAMTAGIVERGESEPDRPAWQWCIIAVVDGTADVISSLRPSPPPVVASRSN